MGLESLQGFWVVSLVGDRDMKSASAHGPQQRPGQAYFISPVVVTPLSTCSTCAFLLTEKAVCLGPCGDLAALSGPPLVLLMLLRAIMAAVFPIDDPTRLEPKTSAFLLMPSTHRLQPCCSTRPRPTFLTCHEVPAC